MLTGTILKVANADRVFQPNSPSPIHAIRHINLEIQRGEYVAIVGHNGSGKSTLAKHLNGLLLPTSGDVWVKTFNTKDAAHRIDIRSMVGMIFQTPDNQIVATIVEEDVAFGPENLGVPPDEIRERVDWALDVVGMRSKRRHAPHLLSGGEKQRVAIAGVLAMRPEVLVLDESTALLDPAGRESVLQILEQLNKEGITIVAITHIMSEAAQADRVIVMDHGTVAMDGTPREIFGQHDRLRELQLDVPEVTQLSERLHQHDSAFPRTLLSVGEWVDAFERFWITRPRFGAPVQGPAAKPAAAHAFDSGAVSTRSSDTPIISVRHLAYDYMRGTPLQSSALRGMDIEVYRGETIGIIGRTGSGKSTLIQHFNALVHPQRGSVNVLGYDLSSVEVDRRELRRRVGLVFQFPEAQLFERYVGDDVAFGPWEKGLRGDELRASVRQAMEAVGLSFEGFKNRPLYSLSGGERRRAALAGVLAIKPEILVLDEPTAGLDPRGHRDILERIRALQKEWGMTLIIVSHNMEDISRLCDRVYVIDNGENALDGAPREIFSQPERLKELGLGVPQVVEAYGALRKKGFNVPFVPLTIEQAEAGILEMLSFEPAQCVG